MSIKAIDKASVHHITSGQVVIDLQTAVKELLENSVDAHATNIEVRFKNHGLSSIEVIDNGCGIAEEDHESIALKHHTSKLETFSDLTSVQTFGFRGEALSSLCALSEQITITTATAATAPIGTTLVADNNGKIIKRSTSARSQGTSITLTNIFSPLAVRRKELERNIKREFGKALSLLNAYALGPCATTPGIRLMVTNQQDKGAKSTQIKTLGSPSCRASVTALWGPKSLDSIVDMDVTFEVEKEKIALKRLQGQQLDPFSVQVKGLISKFAVGCGRTSTDRQFFYINGRPCNMPKVQKTFNEVYRSFNATQSPFIVADLILPTESYDVNVSPDKRTILLHSEGKFVAGLKAALEVHFAPTRSTFDLGDTQTHSKPLRQSPLTQSSVASSSRRKAPVESVPSDNDNDNENPADQDKGKPHPPQPSRRKTQNQDTLIQTKFSIPSSEDQEPSGDDTPMEVDEGTEAAPPEVPTVVLDTSQTNWGQRMNLPARTKRVRSSSPLSLERDNEHEEGIDVGHLSTQYFLKKRKSDIGPVPAVHVPPDVEMDESTSPATSSHASGSGHHAHSLPEQSVPTVLPVRVPRSQPPNKGNKSQTLQSQLVAFARPGSQIASKQRLDTQPINEDDDEGDEEEHSKDEEEEEEEDELQDEDMADDRVQPKSPDDALPGSDKEQLPLTDPRLASPQPSRAPVRIGTSPIHVLDSDEDEDNTRDTNDASSSLVHDPSDVVSSAYSQNDLVPRPEILKRGQGGDALVLKFDAKRVKRTWLQRSVRPTPQSTQMEKPASVPLDAGVSNTDNDERAASALSRVIEKTDFAEMDILGQFNLGFIIVRRRGDKEPPKDDDSVGAGSSDDLFIVDQHAADEKYNYETLQATTNIASQKLFRPRPLELTASDELIAIENLEILQRNGFEIDVDHENSISDRSRLKLTAQPVSKSTTFDIKDLEEVIHLMRDRPGGQMVRCSKARAMFAMRACRKSVMVGMPLTYHQMTTVVRHMGTMDQPWNCPHGRPTMRHLLDIRARGSRSKDGIDWGSFQ